MNEPIEIPRVLLELGDNIRYIRLKTGEHDPAEKKHPKDFGWTSGEGGRRYNDAILNKWISQGYNYGYHAVGGNVCIFDCDDVLYDPALISLFDNTFTVKTGRGYHFIFTSDLESDYGYEKIVLNSPSSHIGHILLPGMKFQTVGPNCIHPNGGRYEVVRDVPLRWIPASDIRAHIDNYIEKSDIESNKSVNHIPEWVYNSSKNNLTEMLDLRIEDVGYPVGQIKQNGCELKGVNPIHGSTHGDKGANYSINPTKNVWHCWRDDSGGDPALFLAIKHGIISCKDAKQGAIRDQATFTKLLDIIRHGGEGQYLADKLIECETRNRAEYFKQTEIDCSDINLSEILTSIRHKQSAPVATKHSELPDYVLSIPGILQEVVNYYNATAAKPQPQIAVQTAIAIGSVILGRRWFSNEGNGTNMYLAVIAKSSAGKEHIKTVLEKILYASDNGKLIGPPGYTSAGGLASALFKQPNHIAAIDEFGRLLESTNKSGNSNQLDAITGMLQVYGRQMGIYSPPGYSDIANIRKPKRRGEEQEEEVSLEIHHPALTLLGITTPSTLFDNLNSTYISNGFIPRFVAVDSIYGRQVSRRRNLQEIEIPQSLISWCYEKSRACEGEENLSDLGPHFPPKPIIIPFMEESYELLEAYEEEYQKYQDENEHTGLDVMWGRNRENAQRLSVIAACSCNSMVIKPEHVAWAIAYVKFYSERMIKIVGGSISDTNFEAAKKSVYTALEAAGERGLTLAEIADRCRKYAGLDMRTRSSVMDAVCSDYGCGILPSPKQRGKKRIAYAINKYIPIEETD